MNIVLGFGPYHVDVSKTFLNKLGDTILTKYEEDLTFDAVAYIKDEIKQLGTWGDKKWPIVYDMGIQVSSKYETEKTVVFEGTYSHYRNDHPLSPDGIACWTLPFCLVVRRDEGIWGNRSYVSI